MENNKHKSIVSITALVVGIAAIIGITSYFISRNTLQPVDTKTSTILLESKKSKTVYATYSDDALKSAKTDSIALFFYAPWCTTCIAMEQSLKTNLDDIQDLTILKIDYDTAKDLKKQYNVTMQSTWVIVDKEGKELTRGTSFTKASQIETIHLQSKKKEVSPTSQSSSTSASTGSTRPDKQSSQAGLNTQYEAALLANANTGKVVIFFDAPWCTSCQTTNRDINANIQSIPHNFTILHADYDTSLQLRQKYGVTIQHTFVQIDENGNLLKKATGLNTLQDIVAFAQ